MYPSVLFNNLQASLLITFIFLFTSHPHRNVRRGQQLPINFQSDLINLDSFDSCILNSRPIFKKPYHVLILAIFSETLEKVIIDFTILRLKLHNITKTIWFNYLFKYANSIYSFDFSSQITSKSVGTATAMTFRADLQAIVLKMKWLIWSRAMMLSSKYLQLVRLLLIRGILTRKKLIWSLILETTEPLQKVRGFFKFRSRLKRTVGCDEWTWQKKMICWIRVLRLFATLKRNICSHNWIFTSELLLQ